MRKSASAPHRENLAAVRKGEFEGMAGEDKATGMASRLWIRLNVIPPQAQ